MIKRKFVIFNPSTLDTQAKYWPYGPFSAPVVLLAVRIWCTLSRRKFLQHSTKAIAFTVVFISYEGETFVMNSESFVQCANCFQELCTIIHLTQYFNTDHLRLMTRNWLQIPLMAHNLITGIDVPVNVTQNGPKQSDRGEMKRPRN